MVERRAMRTSVCFVGGAPQVFGRRAPSRRSLSGIRMRRVARKRQVAVMAYGFVPVDKVTVKNAVQNFAMETVKIAKDIPRTLWHMLRGMLSAFEWSAGILNSLVSEFERLCRTQPIDPAGAGKPNFFPDGMKMILLTLLVTYLSIRLMVFLLNLCRFGFAVFMSTTRTMSNEWPVRRMFGRFAGITNDGLIFDDDSESYFEKSGDFRAREMTDEEPAEWVNAAVRKIWRLFPEELSTLGAEVMQESIDENLLENRPPFVDKIVVESLQLGDRPFWIRNVEKLPTKIDSHLAYNFNFRYSGDASFVLKVALRGPFRRFGLTVPVLVSDIDIDAKSWVRAKLTREPPYLYEVAGAFAEEPTLGVVIKPFKAVNLMTVPGLSRFLRHLLVEEVPKQFTLPKKIIMFMDPDTADVNAFRSILDQTDDDYKGVLAVTLIEAAELVGATSMGLSNPFCYIRLNDKVVKSKNDTNSHREGSDKAPVWNQQFELLVKDPRTDILEVEVHNRFGVMSRPVGSFQMRLASLQEGKKTELWVPLRGGIGDKAKLHLFLNYRKFVDDSDDEYFSRIRDNTRRKIKRKKANVTGALPAAPANVKPEISKDSSKKISNFAFTDYKFPEEEILVPGVNFNKKSKDDNEDGEKDRDVNGNPLSAVVGIWESVVDNFQSKEDEGEKDEKEQAKGQSVQQQQEETSELSENSGGFPQTIVTSVQKFFRGDELSDASSNGVVKESTTQEEENKKNRGGWFPLFNGQKLDEKKESKDEQNLVERNWFGRSTRKSKKKDDGEGEETNSTEARVVKKESIWNYAKDNDSKEEDRTEIMTSILSDVLKRRVSLNADELKDTFASGGIKVDDGENVSPVENGSSQGNGVGSESDMGYAPVSPSLESSPRGEEPKK